MKNTLFLYFDILGFSELTKTPRRVDQLFRVLDSAALHRDAGFKAIVFSDTLLAYHLRDSLNGDIKANELMFLIDFVRDIFLRLIGSGIYFRAIITEGPFQFSELTNIKAFYGEALIDAYRKEKTIKGTGLYLDRRLEKYNQVYHTRPFSPCFHFVYLTHTLNGIIREQQLWPKAPRAITSDDYPIPSDYLTSQSLEFKVYPEVIHLQEIYGLKDSHPNPDVRTKHLATWCMYKNAFPMLTEILVACHFNPSGIANMDWTSARLLFENDFKEYWS